MVKKYKEYKESKLKRTPLSKILSKEELEDQFLRLEEIFHKTIYISYLSYGPKIYSLSKDRKQVLTLFYEPKDGCYIITAHDIKTKKEKLELENVAYRIEEMYPVQVVINDKFYNLEHNYKIHIVKK